MGCGHGSDVAPGRRFHGPVGLLGSGTVGGVGGQVDAGRANAAFALAADDPGGGVQQPVAQGLGFGVGQRGVPRFGYHKADRRVTAYYFYLGYTFRPRKARVGRSQGRP